MEAHNGVLERVYSCRSENPMLGYEFCIDTGHHTLYCYKKSTYGAHENKFIMKHVNKLLEMSWIKHFDTGG